MSLETFAKIGDNHGNAINEDLAEKFFEWLKDFNPKIRIHCGDVFNFAALRKKATDAERAEAIAPDYGAGTDFLKRFFDGGNTRRILRGNHDERIYNLAHSTTDAALQHYAGKMVTEIGVLSNKLRAPMLPYDSRLGVLEINGLRTIHGYAAGIGAARKFAMIYGTCAYAHTHSMDICPVEKWPEVAVAHGTGCLCEIDQPYNSTQPGKLRHENGWLYGYTDGTRATYFQAKYKDGKIHVAENIKAY